MNSQPHSLEMCAAPAVHSTCSGSLLGGSPAVCARVLAHLDLTSVHLNLESRLLCLCLILRGLLLRRLEGELRLRSLFSPRGHPAFGPAPGSHGMSPLAGPGDATQAEHHQAGCRFPVSSVPLGMML